MVGEIKIDLSNVILCDFRPQAREIVEKLIEEIGVVKAIGLLIADDLDPVFVKGLAKNIMRKRGVNDAIKNL